MRLYSRRTFFLQVCLLCFLCIWKSTAQSFAGPFSPLFEVRRTFGQGGFEGDVKVPVRGGTNGNWKMTLTFDRPVKGFQVWKGRVTDVASDFTYYVISNQPWNGYLQAGTFDFNVLGYSPHGLPSLKVTFQGQVHGQAFPPKSPAANEKDADFTVDYSKVIEYSLLFFEAQRSGKMPADNRISWKLDSALYDGGAEGVDLTGGYYIGDSVIYIIYKPVESGRHLGKYVTVWSWGGDYIKFGFPMAFAITQLAWGALEFAGGYAHAQQTVNLFKAIKWGTDYFIKAHPQDNVLYGMVGDPTIDHGHWVSGNNINWRRPAFKLTENEPGSDLAAETSAALAAAALLFSTVAPDYSTELLRHAEQLYLFADTHRAKYDAFSIPGASGFYPSSGYGDELVWAAIWLHKASYKQSYLDDAVAKYSEFGLGKLDTEKGFTYDNKILAIQLILSELTGDHDTYIAPVFNFCDTWSSPDAPKTPDGLLSMPKIKSKILFVANTAFLCTLAAEETLNPDQASQYQAMARMQIAEVLGKDSGISYMVGYGKDYPKKLHDRDSSCPTPPQECGWGFFGSPSNNAHELTGAVVGGPDASGHLVDTRKNFVGNQPHLLHNSAFQSVTAGILYIESINSGQPLLAMDPQEISREVFAIDTTSQLDACSSSPCENNGQCTSVEGFNYLCTCPENVFGINCEHRMTPILKFVNTWSNGAEIKLELPNLQPTGAWQLKMGFPHDCPLTELDVWNACLNVADSSLSSRVVFFQQIGWQEKMQTIGVRFQFSEARFLRNCFREAAYSFVVIDKAAPSLQWRFPEDCPKQLPHPLEGSGSGYMEPIEPFASRDPIATPDPIPFTTSIIIDDEFEVVDPVINAITLPPITQPPSTLAPRNIIIPLETHITPPDGQNQLPVTNAPPSGIQQPALRWMSEWGSGGQGQITLEGTKPNNAGEWLLVMRLPQSCLLDSIQFWEACTVESLSDPYNGVIALEQISWQIHKSFIGFTAHFHVQNAQASSTCLQSELFSITYRATSQAYNRNPDTCRKEYKDIRNPSLPTGKKPDDNIIFGETGLAPIPTPYIDPDKVWIPQNTALPVPPISRFRSVSSTNSSVKLAWRKIPLFVDFVEITYHPAPIDETSFQATLTENSVRKSSESAPTADIEERVEVVRSLTSVQLTALLPGMRYQFSARLHAGKLSGPMSSVFVTTGPLDVENIKSASVDGISLRISWNQPKGIHQKYRISYFPEGRTGNPSSPFYVMGNQTSALITGLSTNTDFIVTMVTRADGIMSDGVYTFARTVPDQCSAILCQVNEVCLNQRNGSNCVCRRGFTGLPCSDIDECASGMHVCHEDATCQNTIGSFTCTCREGFVGDGIACYDVDECASVPNPCNGPCLNIKGSYRCSCEPGYTGNVGECTDIDECATGTSSCPLGTTCTNNPGSFECSCGFGMELVGGECIDIDECTGGTHNCSISSVCVDIVGGFVCVCGKGFTLVDGHCQDMDECVSGSHLCDVQATCTNVDGGYQCACKDGFIGDGRFCAALSTTVDPLSSNECLLGSHNCHVDATCVDTTDSFTCTCNFGYTGDGISCVDVDECATSTHTCHAQSTCNNLPGGFNCACNPGYQGNGWTCTAVSSTTPNPLNVNECLLGTDDCSDLATCVDTSQSFDCICNNGYFGNGKICVDVDECLSKTASCDVNAFCTNTVGSYICTCNNGYQGDGQTCTVVSATTSNPLNVNECLLGTDDCSDLATCVDTSQSFDCICNNGYFGNGKVCVDVDECLAKTASCDVNAFCTNTVGSYACTCNNGFQGDGQICTVVSATTAVPLNVNECLLGTDDCSDLATCVDTSQSFDCICNNGYFGNGKICVDVDECLAKTSSCDVNAFCTNTVGSYACTCNNGYQGDGQTCTADSPTTPNPSNVNECLLGTDDCSDLATCVDTSQSFDCICNNGYFGNGKICVDIDECLAKTASCNVDAFCTNIVGSYTCTCNNGYQGDGQLLCDDIDECVASNDCHSNATCVNSEGSYSCQCPTGYHGDGKACDDIDECAGNLLCHPDAVCTNSPGSFMCFCPPGFTGDGFLNCDDVNECLDPVASGCDANATCQNSIGSYSCLCAPGFTGDGKACVSIV